MLNESNLLIGGNLTDQIKLNPKMGNRHGLIAGATGTGKTVTLQVLAEGFSKLGVPVFMADIKGDLSGLANAASAHPKIEERIKKIKITDYQSQASPVVFWDVYGKLGHPLRTTVSDMGPLLLSNLLELNDTQTGVLYACFKIADDNGLLLLDFNDLRSMLTWVSNNTKELKGEYGNITSVSIGAIQRDLLILQQQGVENFLGEPALRLEDLMRIDWSGRGFINVMDVTQLMQKSPRLYATILLWLLSELFENLPEVGDADKPKFVMFFDEAHLLFDDAPKALTDKIEQIVRLIRSKGVGVYFISQSPMDIPENVLGQLGLRIQHALRAFTPKDQKAIKLVAQTFRQNPNIDITTCLSELGIGEALVSTLDENGSPTQVERTLIRPPESQIGPIKMKERAEKLDRSPVSGKYDTPVDRESAHELLKIRAEEAEKRALDIEEEKARKKTTRKKPQRSTNSPMDAMIKSAARAIGTKIGGKLIRGLLGSLLK
jgi:DNA helicase HerA-like ATPase